MLEIVMPRSAVLATSFALLLATPGVVTPVWAGQPIDGWNGYKFGMSPDAARAVPGATFGPFSPRNMMNENIGAMASKKVQMNGRDYTLDLNFDASQKMNHALLQNTVTGSQADCEKRFLDLVALMEKPYGAFKAPNPQRARDDSEKPPMSLVWKKQGASGYQLTTVFLDGETASAWKARVMQGKAYLDISATWSGKPEDTHNACLTSLDFNAS
jgi:hypothetical protein